MTEESKFEHMYTNAQPDYMWYIRRRGFTHLAELIEFTSNLEAIPMGNMSREASREAYRELQPGARRRDTPKNRACAPDNAAGGSNK